ncbi:MAG: hypothetical protein WAO55_00885 [Candidatus Manganitrophaceae bacterium]
MEVGLWIRTEEGESVLIKKDPHGYPDLIAFPPATPINEAQAKREKVKLLYEKLTGKAYPHPNATTRQVLWDFLEVAIQHLP